jgi:transcriptional regulator
VTSLGGKFKMSQEMGEEDQQGVVEGMEALETADGDYVAKHVRERGKLGEAARVADAGKVEA